ncbi:MAG: glycosyltransferase family 2 protein [Halobacteriota archaeon]
MDEVNLSVVIPCYNEEDNIKPLYSELKEALSDLDYELVFVDDGSTDSTFDILKELHSKDERVKAIKLRKNFGQSAALRAGFDSAKGEYIASMDSDLQNDPKDIPKLFEKLKNDGYDVVCGWRFNRKDGLSKKVFSRFANWFRGFFMSENIHDSGCTLRVYKREAISDLELYGELHRYIPALFYWKGYKIGEEKVNHRKRKFGETKYNWTRLVKGFLDLIVVTFWQKYSLRPTHIFGGLGLLGTAIGSLIFIYLVILRLLNVTGLSDRPLFTLSIFMIVIGIQFITIGLLADVLIRIYYNQDNRSTYSIKEILE